MLNIDPLLFQPKVIRVSTTSDIGLPSGQRVIRTTELSNSQIMTGTATQFLCEANNNIIENTNTGTRGRLTRNFRNFNNMDNTEITNSQQDDVESLPEEWCSEMYWSEDGSSCDPALLERLTQQNSASIMSFQSNLSNSTVSTSFHSQISDQSESSKEEIISTMINKAKSYNKVEASKILLAMSSSVDNCIAMRQCGCLPLLVQLLHGPNENSNTCHMVHAKRVNFEIRERANQTMRNVVFAQPDDRKGRREARVLRLLEQVRDHCDRLRNYDGELDDNRNDSLSTDHIGPSVAALMKLSFDEDHRSAMCHLGGLQAVAELLQTDHEVHGCTADQRCVALRRYSGMALTNLTFGDGANKALLCSMRPFMEALVAQLYSPSEDLRQVTASVLRNLSWRADPASKRILREVGAVTTLMRAAMEAEKESTLKSILSALWNLSAHCSANKADICAVDGALAFLVSTLTYRSKSKTLAVVENGGGILRNVSSHIAIQNEYRAILRKHNCLQILLRHLKSPSLTVVSNACGTLWNLSARNAVDQCALWEMGAVGMLKKLINSKHKMISMGSSAALKNLLSAKPPGVALGLCVHTDSYRGNTETPSLHIRKEKALSTELDQNLAETFDNTDSPKTSPSHHATNDKNNRSRRHISPSARYMTSMQHRRNDLLSTQNRIEDKNMYVVEEKHNGAFQVAKNAKQQLSRREEQIVQPQIRPRSMIDDSVDINKIPDKLSKRNSLPPGSAYSRLEFDGNTAVEKEYRATERLTNIAQQSRSSSRSKVPESKIPLPKSYRLDGQRSQSASPVSHRRNIPQPQKLEPQPTVSHITKPKQAWGNAPVKKELESVNINRGSATQVPESNTKLFKPCQRKDFPPDDYGTEDEVKIYETEDTPLNYSLSSSMNDLEEAGVNNRCSLNIRTNTNVKLMKNHPLLMNAAMNKAGDGHRSYNPRQTKDYRNFEGGRTVDFSVQSDYDIEEPLSMLSRTSSVGSVGSFDQPSFHDDESTASDHSNHGIESPFEYTNSSYKDAVSSQKGSEIYRKEHDNFRAASPLQKTPNIQEDDCKVQTGGHSREDANDSRETHAARSNGQNSEIDALAARLADDNASSSSCREYDSEGERSGMQNTSDMTDDTEFVTCASNIEDAMSSVERDMLERCIRAGLEETQEKVFQKKQSSSQNKALEKQDKEEKGKEDERKAEKKTPSLNNRAEICDSKHIDFAQSNTKPSNSSDASTTIKESSLDYKGNRRFERKRSQDKSKNIEMPPSQLEFLMTPKVTKSEKEENISINVKNSNTNGNCFGGSSENEFKHFEVLDESSDQGSEDGLDKDVDMCTSEDSSMLSSTLLYEAREIAEALLGARVDSTEDMTVSTLSCLSDIDNARPPSAIGDMGSLSMTSSSEENLKAAVAKECQKLLGKKPKKSLLRELQVVRLNSDNSKGFSDSPENLSIKSMSASDLLANANPPSILDEMSLTDGSDQDLSLSEKKPSDTPCISESVSERMNDAAAIAQLYTKELCNITGTVNVTESAPQPQDVTAFEITENGCETIGSDTELEDDLPCDDEEIGSETLQAPFRNSMIKDESYDNLTVTLTEDPEKNDMSPSFEYGFFMSAEELKALQENADRILSTLNEAEISDDDDDEADHCGMSNGDMLDDETMSLVSNESDEELPSPDGQKNSTFRSPISNRMLGIIPRSSNIPSKPSLRKTHLPQNASKEKTVEKDLPPRSSETNNCGSRLRPSASSAKVAVYKDLRLHENNADAYEGFDSRTFTRKKPTVPSGTLLPVHDYSGSRNELQTIPQLISPTLLEAQQPSKAPFNKAVLACKNIPNKPRSRSVNSRITVQKPLVPRESDKPVPQKLHRSPSQTPPPQSPLNKTFASEEHEDASSAPRRPSSLSFQAPKAGSPRHAIPMSKQTRPKGILSPQQRPQGRTSLIPCRKSMIPMPSKTDTTDN